MLILFGPVPTPTPAISDGSYAYQLFTASHITLLPNYTEKQTSDELGSSCTAYINGGFYDTSNAPLGLVRIGDTVISKQIQSRLLNGFVSDEGINVQAGNFSIQTGPQLIESGKPLSLKIQNDEHARRMVAAEADTLIFLAIYNADSVFDGPLLADLPIILDEINNKENLGIVQAVNLDGGSASAFYNGTVRLSELTPVGSLLCAR